MRRLPSGTVTFLFSDIECSTQVLERDGQAMGKALSRHHDLFEQVVERHEGQAAVDPRSDLPAVYRRSWRLRPE
jgi:class 3 adenylate cyclase